ncbi:MAG: HlyD family efflux transporter periplasmic adaptor subunit [Flavobacteriales bacterium]|nr:HlyD family efflux transporter periplasmic adaptor subunit [Flavobacteriales bacterium]
MLNISPNSIRGKVNENKYLSFRITSSSKAIRVFTNWLLSFMGIVFIMLFMPWTQNVRGTGRVTSLYPQQRIQTLQSTIDGRFEKWYVTEGDTVRKGDTLVHISEIKDAYFDPELLTRTQEQLTAKEQSAEAYKEKILAQEEQIDQLIRSRDLKLKQLRLKVQSDSLKADAANIAANLAKIQYSRADTLFEQGLVSRFEREKRWQKLQEMNSYALAANNDYANQQTELATTRAEYGEKIAKTRSELFSAQSGLQEVESQIAKLRNQLENYRIRRSFYFVRAPQDAFVTKALKTGIGENIKEGTPIVELMPLDYQLAVEMYIRPVDLPLIRPGQKARVEFDGWPAIVFSGWPNTSFGTFAAEVFAVDNSLSANGRYRILLRADSSEEPWPAPLRFGAGANSILLLNDVPVWYEIWRQLNGFPPEYYKNETPLDKESKGIMNGGKK